ncbi:vancomycin resistance protein [Bacillus lacus]|uniref:Vancomycin resistance protein n=1 Tax=Metabacillus lacus TaxID=1983721 RepID=A0A7X2IVZ3_9BACI|nr:VanW family protein [Metabacillus lacus]MRX70781.1 vancomycin resistance protein [Metabacillus lacus]
MKKLIYVALFSLVLTGCSSLSGGQETEEKVLKRNEQKLSSLVTKDYELEVKLIDNRNSNVLHTYMPSKENREDVQKVVKELARNIDRPMIPVKLNSNGELTGGQSRVILDEKKALELLNNMTAFDKEIELPIEETPPNVSKDTFSPEQTILLGSYKTSFNPTIAGRTQNISISSNVINQTVLGPGDRFYFNLVVGDRTIENGYQKALEIVNKEFVEGIGGGVCQTSSTLYNAVEKAGLEILELHHHSKSVGYVPEGKDATVAYGYKDFKFMNNKDYPVMIRSIVDSKSGTLEVQVVASSDAVSQ